MIIVLNLHSGTKLAGWLRHCLGGRPPLATPLNTVMILHVVTTLFCQLCDNLVTTGLCWENLVTRLLFQLYSHYELVDGLLTDLLQVVGFVGAFSVLIPYFFLSGILLTFKLLITSCFLIRQEVLTSRRFLPNQERKELSFLLLALPMAFITFIKSMLQELWVKIFLCRQW